MSTCSEKCHRLPATNITTTEAATHHCTNLWRKVSWRRITARLCASNSPISSIRELTGVLYSILVSNLSRPLRAMSFSFLSMILNPVIN